MAVQDLCGSVLVIESDDGDLSGNASNLNAGN